MLYTGKERFTYYTTLLQKSNCTKRVPLPCDQVTNTQVDVLITTNIVQFLSEIFSSVIYFEPYRCTVKYELLIHRLKMGKKIFRISSIFDYMLYLDLFYLFVFCY